jgi:2-dehydro-3-deoxyglucarate aldolase/4-hydroxy-2-oxoheptanedioate aldolase
MRDNPVKAKLQSGEPSWGTFVFEFNTTGIARIASEAGAEFVLFDMEHTGWSIETIRTLIATTPASIVPLVRVPAADYQFIARVLDMGAMGIMVPMVESVEHAERIVRAAKYPPEGRRGAAFGIAHDDYRGGDILQTIASANREQILIAQIETVGGLECVEQIAAVEGIDVLWIGQFDLTSSMGIPGQFDSDDFKNAVERVSRACREHGKTAGFMSLCVEEAERMRSAGFNMQALGGDLWLYGQALADQMRAVQAR